MGYRSEVILAVGPEVMPQFMVTMAKSPQAREMCFGDAEVVKDYADTKGAMLFRWDCIKWYDSYEGVNAIQDFIQWCEDEVIKDEEGNQSSGDDYYRFIRIGEEMDDNEVQGWAFDIHIERSATY
jgi:hypothetical protein